MMIFVELHGEIVALGCHLAVVEGKPSHAGYQSYHDDARRHNHVARNEQVMTVGSWILMLKVWVFWLIFTYNYYI